MLIRLVPISLDEFSGQEARFGAVTFFSCLDYVGPGSLLIYWVGDSEWCRRLL